MNWIENCQNWKLPKLKVAIIWMLPIESDLYISAINYSFDIKLKVTKIESCQNWKLPKLKVPNLESCRSWKWVQHFLLSCKIPKLPNCQIAKLPNCQIAKLPNCQVAKLSSCQIAKLTYC